MSFSPEASSQTLSEIWTPAEFFNYAHFSHRKWQLERPLIEENNTFAEVLDLLGPEIDELNGGDKEGVFSKDNIKSDHGLREDYRQQEISDIIIFVMSVFDTMDRKIKVEEVFSKSGQLLNNYELSLATPEQTQLPPQALSDSENETYLILRQELNNQAELLKQFDQQTGNREYLTQILEEVLVYCIAMHSLMGINSSKAVLEKVERNHIKYPEQFFQKSEGQSYSDKRKEVNRNFNTERFPGGEIGDRPKAGTYEYYYGYKEKLTDELSERHQIGLFYQSIAKLIASTYGFSVKVSNLLKR